MPLQSLLHIVRRDLGFVRLRTPQYVLLTVCIILGATANVGRIAWWLTRDDSRLRGFGKPVQTSDGQAVRWAGGYATALVPGTVWRPLRIELRLCGPAGRDADASLPLRLDVNYTPHTHLWLLPGCRAYELTLADVPIGDIALQFNSETGGRSTGVGLAGLSATPLIEPRPVIVHGIVGALFGVLAWTLLLGVRTRSSSRTTDGDVLRAALARLTWTRAACVLLAIWTYLAVWAVLKPPLQSPDEVQQILRASSVLEQPWATARSQLTVDRRFANPLVLATPWQLGKLFYQSANQLTRDDIAMLKAVPWRPLTLPNGDREPTALATYPTGYYAPLFVLAEGTTRALHLTPYQATYAYRAWSLLIAGVLWLIVYRAMLALPDVAPHTSWLLPFLLLNPMLAFVSSAASPDAVTVPLGTLAALWTYHTATTGQRGWLACLALIACGLTKPAAAPLAGGLCLATLLLSPPCQPLLQRLRLVAFGHSPASLLAVARALVLLFLVFYAWSALRFQSGAPLSLDLFTYLRSLISRRASFWITYWGKLGWLDYSLPTVWYSVLFVFAIINAACVVATRDEVRRFAAFCALVFIGYFATTAAGEFVYLPMAGFNIHGRHLLPACLGAGALVLHRVPWARATLVGYLALMNVMLMHQSIVRYFAGDWHAFRLALPW